MVEIDAISDSAFSNGNSKTKIIKRYRNRKLYNTHQSCYLTLDDIAKMIRANDDVKVIENKSKKDITSATLTQIAFNAEKKTSQYAPLSILREIIQHENGTLTNYLAKLGAFPKEYLDQQRVLSLAQKGSDDVNQKFDQLENNKMKNIADTAFFRDGSEMETVLPTSDLSNL